MATLQYLMKFMVYYSLVNLLCFSYDPIEASEIQYRMMKVNKDSQTSEECVPSTRTAGTAGQMMMLEVAHRYGRQCSSDPSSSTEIQLSDDQLRVDHIRARVESNNATSSSLPARSGVALGVGNYVVQFGGLGTLMFDTGSDLTWTTRSFHFDHARINPSSSNNIECDSNECKEFTLQRTREPPECEEDPLSECDFTMAYGDGTTIEGILTKQNLDIITTTNSTRDYVDEVFPDFIMGYVDHRQQPFGNNNINGILGLSRGDFSLVSQTAEKYGEYFRYCLPSNQNSTGYLAFGNGPSSPSIPDANFTNFTRQNDMIFYYVEITSIFVGGTELAMIVNHSESVVFEAIIDSGTVITRLPTDIYTAMRDKFDRIMTNGINNYTKAPAFSIFDTCYDTSNIENMSVPAVSFTFNGNVTVDFDPSGILYAINSSLACFAFAGTNGYVIFGNAQQKTLEVVYDVPNNRLGFRPNACK